MVSAGALEGFTKLCVDEWRTPLWYHRELLAWACNSAPRSLMSHDADFGKAPRWRTLSTAPDWSNDFLARAQADLTGERATLLVMDDLEVADHVPACRPVVPPHVESLHARVSVKTLVALQSHTC